MTTTSTAPTVSPLPQAAQRRVSHGHGAMRANKPAVGGRFADGAPSGPLFYWSASRFSRDFRFGLHPHEGFEIITVVLEGSNFHYDTATQRWVELAAGDLQVIAAGSGLSHDEKVAGGSRAFQIWLDPHYEQALREPPAYRDVPAETFRWQRHQGVATTILARANGPVRTATPGVWMRRHRVDPGTTAALPRVEGELTAVYAVAGSGTVGGVDVEVDDVVRLTRAGAIDVSTGGQAGLDLFVLGVPEDPGYPTIGST